MAFPTCLACNPGDLRPQRPPPPWLQPLPMEPSAAVEVAPRTEINDGSTAFIPKMCHKMCPKNPVRTLEQHAVIQQKQNIQNSDKDVRFSGASASRALPEKFKSALESGAPPAPGRQKLCPKAQNQWVTFQDTPHIST